MNEFPPRVARFEKVSFPQFEKDVQKQLPALSGEEIRAAYDRIILPARATAGSSGYDIRTPFSFTLRPGRTSPFPPACAAGWRKAGACC